MKLSKVFLVSIFITAAILAVIGGLATNVFASKSVGNEPNSETIKAYQEREVAYNKLIEQANQQLEITNQDLQAMQTQLTQLQQPQVNQQPVANVGISIEKAEEIANQAAAIGFAANTKPELVDFEGKAAYEIAFGTSTIYVDAQNGSVLFNGTIPQEVTMQMAAQIASDFLKNKDIFLVDQITFRGAPLYRVIFKNSTIVYLDKTGQITYILRDSMASRQQDPGSNGGGDDVVESSSHEYEDHDD